MPDKQVVLQLIDHVKLPHDTRFIRDTSILEANCLLLTGNEGYSLSKQMLQGYENMQLSPLH